jgi:hypothetical protein
MEISPPPKNIYALEINTNILITIQMLYLLYIFSAGNVVSIVTEA